MFGTTKIPKSQEPSKALIVHHHGYPSSEEKPEFLRFLSIDPGTKNFAMRIETRYWKDVSPKTEMMAKIDFTVVDSEDEPNNSNLYFSLIEFMNSYVDWFPTINVVIIERQMAVNYKMLRMSQHIITYCLMKISHATIIEIQPKLKTRMLDAPFKLDKREVKKWSVEKAMELLTIRKDFPTIDLINSTPKRKKDDLADTITQIEAICVLFKWPLTT